MAIDIKSPQFPESIFEGTLSNWLKKEGQEIKQDEVLAEIETDKVVIEVTAPSDGVMGKVLVKEGATIKSSEVIGSYNEGELKAEIKSAKSLTQDEIKKITDELSNNFKSKIKLNYKQDESLIGGLIVQVGSTMIDTSIKSKLQQIENRMIEA